MAFIEGASISLRPVEESDLDFLQSVTNHPTVRRYLGQSTPTSVAQERGHFEAATERADVVQLLVEAGGDGVGGVEFDPIDWQNGVADLAVWIHPDHQGQGYGREAVELMCAYAFDELRLHKITVDAYAANEASRALFESVGFTQEGVGREEAFLEGRYQDSVYYGLLEHEWRHDEA